MHFVVVDTHRFVKISRHLYCYRRCCNIYLYFVVTVVVFLFFFQVEWCNLTNVYS